MIVRDIVRGRVRDRGRDRGRVRVKYVRCFENGGLWELNSGALYSSLDALARKTNDG